MNFKINSIVIPSILAFALIAGIIPAVFAQNNTGMTSEGGNMTGMTQEGNMTGMTQSQSADEDGNDDDDKDGNDDSDNGQDDKDKGE
jgi:hypothetical protein